MFKYKNIQFETKENIQINKLEYNRFLSKLTKCILTYMIVKKRFFFFLQKKSNNNFTFI